MLCKQTAILPAERKQKHYYNQRLPIAWCLLLFFQEEKEKKDFQKNFHTLPFFPWEFIDYYLSFKYCFLKNWTNKLKKNNSVLTMMAICDCCWHCSWKYRENRISTTHIVLLMLEKKNLKCSFSEIEKKSVVVEEHAQWAKIWRIVEFS